MPSAGWYANAILAIMQGVVDLDTDTFKALLTTVGYVVDDVNHAYRDDVTNELAGGGYAQVTLTGLLVSYDAPTRTCRWAFDDPTWPGVTIAAARRMVIFKSRGGAASADELIVWTDFGADMAVTGGTFFVDMPAEGAGEIAVSI